MEIWTVYSFAQLLIHMDDYSADSAAVDHTAFLFRILTKAVVIVSFYIGLLFVHKGQLQINQWAVKFYKQYNRGFSFRTEINCQMEVGTSNF